MERPDNSFFDRRRFAARPGSGVVPLVEVSASMPKYAQAEIERRWRVDVPSILELGARTIARTQGLRLPREAHNPA